MNARHLTKLLATLLLVYSGSAMATPVLGDAISSANSAQHVQGIVVTVPDGGTVSMARPGPHPLRVQRSVLTDYSMIHDGSSGDSAMTGGGGGSGVALIPEPAVIALIGIGLLGIALGRRRRQ